MMTVRDWDVKPMAGICWATAAGIGKEVADKCGYGQAEWKDLGYTIIGGVISVGIITAVRGVIHKKHNKRCQVQGIH
jgi:hypothetical protein